MDTTFKEDHLLNFEYRVKQCLCPGRQPEASSVSSHEELYTELAVEVIDGLVLRLEGAAVRLPGTGGEESAP